MTQNRPELPSFLQPRNTDEYGHQPASPAIQYAVKRMRSQAPSTATHLGKSVGAYWGSRQGTAAALIALNEGSGTEFFKVPPEAVFDRFAADAALGGDQLIIDVQTHYTSDRSLSRGGGPLGVIKLGEGLESERFKELGKIVQKQPQYGYTLVEYLRCMYVESETSVAILSSGPGIEGEDHNRPMWNSEMMGTRELIDRLAGTGRLINHCTIHPNKADDMQNMDLWADWCKPAGWKVYTMYGQGGPDMYVGRGTPGVDRGALWMLDDEKYGMPFLERVQKSTSPMISAHKGISMGPDTGWDGTSSPRDIGPAAKAFPGVTFLVYHSGYEPKVREPHVLDQPEEGPYTEETAHIGSNRFITSLNENGIGPGSNVYAELGSTWFLMMARPHEAAHVMGKLLSAVGEDNILWGTDSCFYGPPQPLIEAFRAFQIPEEYCREYGYPQLTPTAKAKILGLNAARIYGLDPEKTRQTTRNDDLAWMKAAIDEYRAKGTPRVV